MTAQNRTVNKAAFEQGDQPQEASYVDLIDSFLSIADSTVQSLSSDLTVPVLTATTEVSSPLVRATRVSASAGHFTTISVTGVVTADRIKASAATIDGVVSADRVHASAATIIGVVSADRIHASAATFLTVVSADRIHVSAATIRAQIRVSGTAHFDGPVRGPQGVGRMELVQRVTVEDQTSVANPIAINLPSGADITEINFFVETVFTASASAQTGELVVYLGSGDATAASIISETRVSATGAYDILDILAGSTTLETSRLRNVTSTVHAFLTAKNVATAFTGGGQGILQVRYVGA